MKVLILGGTGAMGASLVQILAENLVNEIYVTSRSPHESYSNVHYIQGNAHDVSFLNEILKSGYDVIVDFMVYTLEEFIEKVELLLSATRQYVFLSSSRVYADNGINRITEESPRLLDVCKDIEFLQTNEYALEKAREENVLMKSKRKNWTIIRPYITYNEERLQLGAFEKEHWLYRAINGKKVVFAKDIAEHWTTLTYGEDVAKVIAKIMNNASCLGEIYNIAGAEPIMWKEVLEIYCNTFKNITGNELKVHWIESSKKISKIMGNEYQVSYDRLFERRFDNKKIESINGEKIIYVQPQEGIAKCLSKFIQEQHEFRKIHYRTDAYMDRLTGEYEPIKVIGSFQQRVKYIIWRYTPFIEWKAYLRCKK